MNATNRIFFSCLILLAAQLLSRADETLPAGYVIDKPAGNSFDPDAFLSSSPATEPPASAESRNQTGPWNDFASSPATKPSAASPKPLTDQDIMDFDSPPSVTKPKAASPKPLTSSQIKARDFMQGISDQESILRRKAVALNILRQVNRWPKDYTADEEKEYRAGNMGVVSAFQFERKCKKHISDLESMIANALKNVRSEKIIIDDR